MTDLYKIIADAEINLDEFLNWQIQFGVTNDFCRFATTTGDAQSIFKYAAILFPRFIEIEGVVLLANHYSPKNWAQWREKHDPLSSAFVVNHVHVDHFLPSDAQGSNRLEDQLGKLLAFFWQIAVNQQFPNAKVMVKYDGDVINFYQNSPTNA